MKDYWLHCDLYKQIPKTDIFNYLRTRIILLSINTYIWSCKYVAYEKSNRSW